MYNFQEVPKVVTTIVPSTRRLSLVGKSPSRHFGTPAMSNVNPYQTAQDQPSAQTAGYNTRRLLIKKIDPISAGKLLGTMYALIGLLFGGFVSLFALVGAVSATAGDAAIGGIIGGLGAIILMPLFYGVLGFVGGVFGAFLYNIIAGMVGGVSLEIEV